MGAWGISISSNDTFADIYDEFIELYNDGFEIKEITEKLITENQETINLSEDSSNFWFAIAKGQWECKSLYKEIFERVKHIILSGEDLRLWNELGASQKDLKEREKVLIGFLSKLQTEKEKPRKRIKKKVYDSIFKKGDCLVYKMDNGNYGGAFVLTDEQATRVGINYIAITIIDNLSKPSIDDFKNTEVYVQRVNNVSFETGELQQKWIDQPQIGGFYAGLFKKNELNIEVIGQLPVYKDYLKRKNHLEVGYGWATLKTRIPYKEEYIKKNGVPELKIRLSEWTKKSWF